MQLFKLYRKLFPFIRPYRGRMAVAALFNTASSFLGSVVIMALIPTVSVILGEKSVAHAPAKPGAVIDQDTILRKFAAYFESATPEEALVKVCIFIFVAFTLKNIFIYINGYIMAVVEGGMVKNLRDQVFERLSFLSIDYYYDRKGGHLLSRLTNDVSVVNSTLASSTITLVREPLQIAFFLYLMFSTNTRLTLVSFGIALASMWLINLLGKTIKQISHRVQEGAGDIMTVAQEMISGIKVVKSFGMERYEVDRFKRETGLQYQASRRLTRIRQLIGPINEALAVGGFIGILWFGGQEVFAGTMRGSEVLFFLATLIFLMQPVRILSELNAKLHEGSAAADNVFSILEAQPTVKPGEVLAPAKHDSPIQFGNVEYKYSSGTENAINGVTLEIFPNEVLALVGPSGAGKTTLVDLLVRFYDPTKGRIILGGKDLREYDLASLRKLFGIVTQETTLFHDTIFNNIAYGDRSASREMIYEAARAANAHDFILQMPNGYDTIAGDRGVRLSGGQRQRIAIARALLKNPPILIFDEATSALDTENEMLVQEAIERLLSERTAVVIAHRLSTIQQADRIVVMDQGRIAEIGTHEQLLASEGGVYQRLYSIQTRAAVEGVVSIDREL